MDEQIFVNAEKALLEGEVPQRGRILAGAAACLCLCPLTENHNSFDALRRLYHHDYAITLDKLPNAID